MASDRPNHVPLTRRTALKSLAAAGVGATGLGSSSVDFARRAGALHESDQPEYPVEVYRRVNDEVPARWNVDEELRINNDAVLWYWGGTWEPEEDAWRHRFMVTAQATVYENWDPVHGESGQEIVERGLTDQELSVQRKSGDLNIVQPYKEEMVGVANPGDLHDELAADPEIDLDDLATRAFEQRDGLDDIDFEERVQEWSANYNSTNEPTLRDFASIGAGLIGLKFPVVGVAAGVALVLPELLNTSSAEDVDPGGGFTWPPDPGIPTSDTGGVAELFTAFDVLVPATGGGIMEVSCTFGNGHGEVENSWEFLLDETGRPDLGECVDARDVVRREMALWGEFDWSTRDTLYYASGPDASVEQPAANRTYAVDEPVPFEASRDLWRNHWHVDQESGGHCSPVSADEVDGGVVDKLHSPGRWRVVHHGRDQAGLSAIDERTIFVTEDASHEVVPADGTTSVYASELSLPQGTDVYTEVDG